MRILLDENFPLARLEREAVLFITQDTDFLQIPPPAQSIIIVSRIPQWIGLAERPDGRIFELVLPGVLHSVA